MSDTKNMTPLPPEPTEPGWYRTSGLANWMIYARNEDGAWTAMALNGLATVVTDWGYIGQQGPVELMAAYPATVVPEVGTPFEFTSRNGEELTLHAAVFEALGAASTCWKPGTGDAVFDDRRAKEVGNKLIDFIQVQANPELLVTDEGGNMRPLFLAHALEDAAERVYKVNLANGWFEDDRTVGDDIALLHSEVSEMLEAYRDGGLEDQTVQAEVHGKPVKPEGFGSEAADLLIRLLDTVKRRKVNLAWEFERKLGYNATRGHKHGGKNL